MRDYEGQTLWIIGASSGIGHSLAEELSGRGAALILSARDEKALQELQAKLGERCIVIPMDVRNAGEIEKAVHEIEPYGKLDGVIFMAGLYKPANIRDLDPPEAADMIATNLNGAIAVVHHVLPDFLNRKTGQIALCGSVAGYRGLPKAQPYGATKAAIINFAESLRAECVNTGVDIKLINPGFVKTRLTAKNDFTMPMIIEPQEAARHIADGLKTKSFEIHFPRKFTWLMKLLRILPYALYFRIIR